MKKHIIVFGILLAVFSLAFVQQVLADTEWAYNRKYLVIETNISSELSIEEQSKDAYLESLTANLSFIPLSTFRQDVLEISSEPEADIENDYVLFNWEEPSDKKLSFGISAELRTENKVKEVRKKVKFPVTNLDDSLTPYTLPSENIDSDNKKIINLAAELAKGQTDLYKAVHKIALWVYSNISYDLSEKTMGQTQKASWVLEYRKGVCDEKTSLFIALCRAVGIPARFTAGIAYTTLELFGEGFGMHSWAEVYFPGYGWVPFDVTYGELGDIDLTHVTTKTGLDPADSSVRYKWKARDIDIVSEKVEASTSIKDMGSLAKPLIKINANMFRSEIDIGSYNLIEAEVENLADYYLPLTLYVSKITNLENIDKNEKQVLLMPKEKKKVYWRVKVEDSLKKNYVYTFPIVVYTPSNISAKASFEVRDKAKFVSLEKINEKISTLEEEEVYTTGLDLNCSLDKEKYYTYESIAVNCELVNEGNTLLQNLEVCLNKKSCKTINLGIGQRASLNFSLSNLSTEVDEITVKAKGESVLKTEFLSIEVLDEPLVEVGNLSYPSEVEYDEKYNVSFIIRKKSESVPKNVKVDFTFAGTQKKWVVESLTHDEAYVIQLDSQDLGVGDNKITVSVKHEDENEREYSAEKEFNIALVNLSFWQRISVFFRQIFS